ncbi:hypothetical protein M758_10G047200 [Ceratodon purpureus]|nr:hypothetical protein M758_10G047200 [Ceratodon purpureus]
MKPLLLHTKPNKPGKTHLRQNDQETLKPATKTQKHKNRTPINQNPNHLNPKLKNLRPIQSGNTEPNSTQTSNSQQNYKNNPKTKIPTQLTTKAQILPAQN